ncbi:MAG: DEAD/DEAH box helicase [Methylotenera sp.]|nr:DEAD/DEAH box helicase [Methylotenera sp.]
MSEFFRTLSEKIITNKSYSQSKQLLFSSYVTDLIGETKTLGKEEIKKLADASQIFHKSEFKDYKDEGAVLLAMLLDLYGNDHPGLIPIANNLFAGSGDFPNIDLLNERYPNVQYRYSFDLHALNDFRRSLNTVDEMDFTLTDFQRVLWEQLVSGEDVITSAPTSAGKTHIILNYLLDIVGKSDGAFAAIVVPTRALITEIAGKLYDLIKQQDLGKDIEICTVPREGQFRAKTFFVMTQERLHEVLLRGDVSFNYLFIDEAHNITDQSRGVLLHITIEKVLENSLPQIIISMPSDSYQNSFSGIFKGIDFKKQITRHSPVAKILINVEPIGKDLKISLLDQDCSFSIKKGFKDTKFVDIVFKLGQGQRNIIYRNGPYRCEKFADELAERVAIKFPDYEANPSQEEAADYVENFIHQDYSLASNLRKGIAFHYGPLPSSVRIMVENLVKDGHVNYIACTSTLAEGVNLPAKNLFLDNPKQPQSRGLPYVRLEDVKLNNITGRAGRMLQHFSGNVFVINHKKWDVQDYFEEKVEEEKKIPTYFKALNEELEKVISALTGTYDHTQSDQYKHYSIANKLLREYASENMANTINSEDLTLPQAARQFLLNTVREAHANLQVSTFTLESNPTVGYIQQNKLYQFLLSLDNFEPWVLPHPKSPKLYDTLLTICYQLNLFGIYIPTDENSIQYICLIAIKWVQGESLKDIITEQIQWNAKQKDVDETEEEGGGKTNAAVRKVITTINSDVTFRLSNALRCYQLLLNNVLAEKGLEMSNVKLHSFLEVGAYKERVINLINLGTSREAAIEIDEILETGIEIKTYADLIDLLSSNALEDVHNVTRKELLGLLKH